MNPWHGDLVEALVAMGERAEATIVSAELGALVAATGSAWSAALHDRTLGLIAATPRDAAEAFERSARRFAEMRSGYDQSVSLELLAGVHRRAGDHAAAQRAEQSVHGLRGVR